MTTVRRPAALLTLSWQQDLSRYPKLNKWLKIDLIYFLMHYDVVRADDRVPRSLCHDIMNLSRVRRRSGKAITYTIRVRRRSRLKLSPWLEFVKDVKVQKY